MAKKKAKARRGKVARRPTRTAKARRIVKKAARRGASRAKVRRSASRAKMARGTARAKARGPAPRAKARRSASRAKATRAKATRSTPRAKAAPKKPFGRTPAAASRPAPVTPRLERARRRLPDVERAGEERRDERMLKAARSGHDDLVSKLRKHTETSPKLTAGDVDAKWEDAYAVGDEAPGGDNPTPDQDRVDDIGKALGVQYQDNEELQGGDEILERDEKRWELDPASSDDWPHDKDKD